MVEESLSSPNPTQITNKTMFTVAKLLELIAVDELQEQKKLEKILKLTKKVDRQKLEIAIKALIKVGIITEDRGLLKRSGDESFIEARLRCSSKGYCFAVRADCSGEDIYIRDQFLNHAWNGDRVLVKISREAVRRRSPEGIVQCILERSSSNILTLLEKEEGKLLAIPLDDRILSSIQLNETDNSFYDLNKNENLVEVKIDRFPIAQYESIGHVVRPLPLDGGTKGDIDILLTKNNLQEEILAPRSTIKNPTEKSRRDLTTQPSLILRSWKEEDSPPLPAMYVEPHSGGIRLWIHSPSVAERVSLGNNLDNWLLQRSETHCLGNAWSTLLSKNLTKACEFKTGEINKAITVELEISAEGSIKDWEFYLSDIRPAAEITTKHLTSIDARKPKSRAIPVALKSIKDHISQIQTAIFFASKIIEDEKNRGLIELDLPIPKINNLSELLVEFPELEFDQWKQPLNKTDPQSILAPLLRTANRAWYQHLLRLKLPGVIIKSENIDTNSLNEVAKSALSLELKLELDSEGIPSAAELSSAFSNNQSRRVLDKLLHHALPVPVVCNLNPRGIEPIDDSENKSISNDNLRDIQAPWVCPSLHYYDIINQHIIISLLKEGKTRPNSKVKETLNLGKKGIEDVIDWPLFNESTEKMTTDITSDGLVSFLNRQHRKAKSLRQGLISMAQVRSTQPHIGDEMEAVISGVQSYGFFAEIKSSMAEGLVHVSSLNDDWYEYRSRQSRLVGRKSKKVYQLGEVVKVKVVKVDILRNQIDLEAYEDELEINTNPIISDNLETKELASSTDNEK